VNGNGVLKINNVLWNKINNLKEEMILMERIKPIGFINNYPVISQQSYKWLEQNQSFRLSYDPFTGLETAQLYLNYETIVQEGNQKPILIRDVKGENELNSIDYKIGNKTHEIMWHGQC
jgi:hypothetical protein